MSCNSVTGSVDLAPEQGSTHGPKTTHSCYLLIYGVGLTQEGLKDWLRQCAKQVFSPIHPNWTVTLFVVITLYFKKEVIVQCSNWMLFFYIFTCFNLKSYNPMLKQFT